MKGFFMLFCFFNACILMAQDLTVSGTLMDSQELPISFVNVLLYDLESKEPLKGTTTEADGTFILKGLKSGTYKLCFSYLGFEDHLEIFDLTSNKILERIILIESKLILDETYVIGKRPTIEKTPNKLVFNVENTTFSVGSTMDLLKKTPGVIVIAESIKIKFSSPILYINGKRVYLSTAEIISLLENTDAANIKAIEVITNPSAKYDADSGTVLNIITSKSISIGYKGSVNTTYTQGIYPKYNFGTSHFYKNKWLNLYANYNYNIKKQFKEDENNIRFFEQDEITTKSIWETCFNRTSKAYTHSGNVVLDFSLDDINTLNLISNLSISPKNIYHNNGNALIFNPDRELDYLNTTTSNVDYKKDNVAFELGYSRLLNDKGGEFSASANYIYYNHTQNQTVNTDYFLSNHTFLRDSRFFTNSIQRSRIFTLQTDLSTTLWGGTIDAGLKYSTIDTGSILDFFDTVNNLEIPNYALSDNFKYEENIFAEYINYEGQFDTWSIVLGLRGEYNIIDAISQSLGKVNSGSFFKFFPSLSINYTIDENNIVGLTYKKSVRRPRYESLNPFKYFITENNFIAGNPDLVAAVDERITLSYTYKSKLFFELYYQNVKNALDNLSFQDNENSTLRTVEDNLKKVYQYSFDITYFQSITDWWYFHLTSSSYYFYNEFYALESSEESNVNDTFGQYLGVNNNFTLSNDRTITADISALYISRFVFGSRFFTNQSFVNFSIRKEFWDKRASFTLGIDDIFDTLNDVVSRAKYYNQDNRFFTNQESRLFRAGFKYNFGNARLRDNSKQITTDEGDRLN